MYDIMQRTPHSKALDDLVYHLDRIDENPRDIRWIMKEGIWTPHGLPNMHTFPDLILVYDNYAIPVELKTKDYGGQHHLAQLNSGRVFINTHLHMPCPYSKLARYEPIYPHEIHTYKRLEW